MSVFSSSKSWLLLNKIQAELFSAALIAITLMLAVRGIIYGLLSPVAHLGDWPMLLVYSLRWDAKLWAAWSVVILLLSIGALWSVRLQSPWLAVVKYANRVFLALISALSLLHIFYWQALGNPYDAFLFSIVDDETAAVLRIFWEEYHPLRNGLLLLVALAAIFMSTHKLSQMIMLPSEKIHRPWARTSYLLLMLISLAIIARGSLSLFPLSQKTTHFSASNFVNDLAINAPMHFYYALKEARRDVLRGDPRKALQVRGYASVAEASQALLFRGAATEYGVPLVVKSQAQLSGKRPSIIFVMMESWSTQLLLADAPNNDLLGAFRSAQQQGALFTQSLSTRQGTGLFIESTLLNTALLGISNSAAKRQKFHYSNIAPFIAHNYHTAFVSGGARTWLNQGAFWRAQGVNDYWDMTDVIAATGAEKHSDWGVHDEFTFKFALDKAQQLAQAQAPFFMFVMTTSNHPPHSVPSSYAVGAHNASEFAENLVDPNSAQKQMATFKYSSDQLGLFLQALAKSGLADNTIVVATGDHTMKMFYQYSAISDKLLAGSVPLYFQVPAALLQGKAFATQLPASHRDIFPTLFELALPGAEYLKTGFNLLDATEPKAAWHDRNIWLTDAQVSFADSAAAFTYSSQLKVGESVPVSEKMRQYRAHTNAVEALLEWQVRQEYLAGKK